MRLRHLIVVLITGALTACGTSPERPSPPGFEKEAEFGTDVPQAASVVEPTTPWWRRTLAERQWQPMEAAITANPRLREAEAVVAAARARLEQADADSGPQVTLRADAQGRRIDDTGSTSRSAAIGASLPIDLRGSIAARRRGAAYALRAAEADYSQLRDDLARDYLLAQLDNSEGMQRIALLEQQLDVATTLLRLIELRFTQGLASSVDILQQRDQVASLRQQLPLTRLEVVSARNRLRFAAGITPERALPAQPDGLLEVRAGYPALVPIDLLQRRASLRAAGARLQAADAEFAAALADRLPEIGLSAEALARVVASDYTRLVSATLDAALTLFDSGRKRAIASERRAQLVAAGERYLEAWLSLVLDLDNWLHEERSLGERIGLSQERLANAETLLTAARRRYERGVSDYLPVLEALRGLQQQQRDLLALRADLARVRIRLHHGFGRAADGEAG